MATASPVPISINEYLHTRYEPDRDYVDGLVEARNVGAPDHARFQSALAGFINRRREWGVRAEIEVRMQTSASHVRVADVAVLSADQQDERDQQVLEKPPVAVVEILSPEDRVPRHTERVEDYRRMGIKSIWIIDPAARKGFDCSSGEWTETEHFAVPESPIRIDLPEFFAEAGQNAAR